MLVELRDSTEIFDECVKKNLHCIILLLFKMTLMCDILVRINSVFAFEPAIVL